MIRKYYILALTFLCLFFGQVSYGQDLNEGSESNDYGQTHIDFWSEMYGFDIISLTLDENGVPTSFTTSDGLVINLLGEVIVINDYHDLEPDPETTGNGSPDNPCPSGDTCECYGIGCPEDTTPPTPDEDNEQTWYLDYDGDGYHATTTKAVVSPGDKWKTLTSGEDCDDTRPQYTTACCTRTCESGYKLNIDTCECIELPPCWGTIQDFETSNSFNSNTILNELNSALSTFGISTDIMDMLNESKIFDPKIIAQSTDIATHANAIGNIGDGSQIIMSYFEYIDEPSTQNLLKLALDSVSPFLSPAASLALSTIDFYKDSNGDSKLDLLLRAAGDYIDRQRDCNLGLGVRNAIF